MKKKTDFAYMLMGGSYVPSTHNATFKTPSANGENIAYIVTVRNFQEAIETANELFEKGVGCIEVCGAFSAERVKELITATDNKIAIGYSTHFESENEKFDSFFGGN